MTLKLEDLPTGCRVILLDYEKSGTVVFNKPQHSSQHFAGCALIQVDDQQFGWVANDRPDLAPQGEPHINGLSNLYWARMDQLALLELELDFGVDG